MPEQTGMAFVVIVHLSPEHESMLPETLTRSTSMRVRAAQDGDRVEANCVYVIPPGKLPTADRGAFATHRSGAGPRETRGGGSFFRLLADTHGPRAAAIILSGADADGAGIRRIKERGGLTIAQDPDEAEHRGMPQADQALAKGRASDERWHMRKDGSRLWASGVMMLLRDRRGEAIGFVKIFRDRTAELRAKEALEKGTQGNRSRPCRCRSCQQGEGSIPRRSLSRAAHATHTGAHVGANTFAPQGLAASRH